MNARINRFFSSDILVIAHLLNEQLPAIIAYDPDQCLVSNDSFSFKVAGDRQELISITSNMGGHPFALVNFTRELLPETGAAYLISFHYPQNKSNELLQMDYISNPNATLRWIYPSRIRKPLFLGFYNFTYWKASLYKFIVKCLFVTGLKKLVRNGTLFIQSKDKIFAEQLLGEHKIPADSYAIFTGTAGPNRKIIMAGACRSSIQYFYKIPLSDQSRANICNEFQALKAVQSIPFENVVVPQADWMHNKILRLDNIKPANPYTLYRLGEKHINFLDQLYSAGHTRTLFRELAVTAETNERLERIGCHPKLDSMPFAKELLKKLNFLRDQLTTENPLVALGRNHGDFTRWNSYLSDDKIFVYDWEMSRDKMPLLYDLFHFEIQVAVFSVYAELRQVNQRLYETLTKPYVKRLIDKYGVDPLLYMRLYLLIHTAYYLEVYLNQFLLPKEDLLLLKTWNLLLYTQTEYMDSYSHRKHFIDEMFRYLSDKTYVVLKNTGKDIQDPSLASDIDLLVGKQQIDEIMKWIVSDPNIQKSTCVRKSFMVTIQLFFIDNSFLSLDLLYAFHRKSIQYIDAERALKHTVMRNGIKVLSPTYDYLYIFLFYQINYADVPEKYAKHFTNLSLEEENRILMLLKNKIGIDPYYIPHTFPFSARNRRRIMAYLKTRKENNRVRRTIRFFQYCRNVFVDLLQNKGLVLTFSGVDGAGKSTILAEVREMLETKYRKKVVVIRHRPSLFPILSAWKYGKEAAEQRCIDSLPRKGNNKSGISSILRFGYYYLDYIIGQIIVYARYTLRGYIVLYDRYYFDFIVDGKRSNILLNKGFIQQLYRFVYKPELNIFLYASPEVILKRKKELPASDIVQLTSNYKELFKKLGDENQYLCIENIDKADTIYEIEKAFIELN